MQICSNEHVRIGMYVWVSVCCVRVWANVMYTKEYEILEEPERKFCYKH